MVKKISVMTRLIRSAGVLLGIGVSVVAAVSFPLFTFTLTWNFIYGAMGGKYPDFILPDWLGKLEESQIMSWRGEGLPSKFDVLWVAEITISLAIILFMMLIVFHGLIPMSKRIKNTIGTNAIKVSEDHSLQLYIDQLQNLTGGPPARVWIIPRSNIEAYALSGPLTGNSILVSEGLLSVFDWGVSRWVLAHEYGHIKNADSRSKSLWIIAMHSAHVLNRLRNILAYRALVLISAIPLILLFATPIALAFKAFAIIGGLGIRLGMLIFKLFDTWAGRQMEYAADEFAATIEGPEPGVILFTTLIGEFEPRFNGLFASHPKLSDRIEKINKVKPIKF